MTLDPLDRISTRCTAMAASDCAERLAAAANRYGTWKQDMHGKTWLQLARANGCQHVCCMGR